jgi:hypothetical protein
MSDPHIVLSEYLIEAGNYNGELFIKHLPCGEEVPSNKVLSAEDAEFSFMRADYEINLQDVHLRIALHHCPGKA